MYRDDKEALHEKVEAQEEEIEALREQLEQAKAREKNVSVMAEELDRRRAKERWSADFQRRMGIPSPKSDGDGTKNLLFGIAVAAVILFFLGLMIRECVRGEAWRSFVPDLGSTPRGRMGECVTGDCPPPDDHAEEGR